MDFFKIACTKNTENLFSSEREKISAYHSDFTNVSAVVLEETDIDLIKKVQDTQFGIPIFVVSEKQSLDPKLAIEVDHIIDINQYDLVKNSREIANSAKIYEEKVLPPFFNMLEEYYKRGNYQFDCPGHQGGQFFRKHPTGRFFYEYFGEALFRSDICNADVDLGDLLIHEGSAMNAEEHAAEVFHADKTYFVLNGTSTSNAIAVRAAVAPGDLVLFDRNNHKSIYNSALVTNGGKALYLETARNPFGFIGGIDAHCFEEDYIRQLIKEVEPQKAQAQRPIRLAVIQLGTYDGTVYNAKQVIEKIGHLCEYILFDSAWLGYEQFIPIMKDCSPLLLDLTPEDPGILVTQSVHKQQAGFSQTSQIHKKDHHIKDQKRYITHKRFNNAYMMYSSTSPFYALFAALDVNAKMQAGAAGRKLWLDCVKNAIEARKDVLNNCEMIKPFIPPTIKGKKWQEYDTDIIAEDIEFFKFHPGEKWHSFEGYGENQYFVDPNKFMLTTPGICAQTGEYQDFGIPATILANYLRENGIVPEKNDLNSILFLMTPAETRTKMKDLVAHFVKFEKLVMDDVPLAEALPRIYQQHLDRYKHYTIRQLCQEMHDFYKTNNAKLYQKQLFRKEFFPKVAMSPDLASWELTRNNAKLVSLDKIVGEIALEGSLPYPPGLFCVAPGEVWNETAQKYFTILQDGITNFPGFAPEIQGVYFKEENGKQVAYGYVLDQKSKAHKK